MLIFLFLGFKISRGTMIQLIHTQTGHCMVVVMISVISTVVTEVDLQTQDCRETIKNSVVMMFLVGDHKQAIIRITVVIFQNIIGIIEDLIHKVSSHYHVICSNK